MYHGMPEGPMSDEEYRAHEDAEALARANEVKGDSARLGAAKAAANKKADMIQAEADAMRKAAKDIGGTMGSSGGSIPQSMKADGWKMHGQE